MIDGKLKRGSEVFKFSESVAFQAMADISMGKNITRFEELEE